MALSKILTVANFQRRRLLLTWSQGQERYVFSLSSFESKQIFFSNPPFHEDGSPFDEPDFCWENLCFNSLLHTHQRLCLLVPVYPLKPKPLRPGFIKCPRISMAPKLADYSDFNSTFWHLRFPFLSFNSVMHFLLSFLAIL